MTSDRQTHGHQTNAQRFNSSVAVCMTVMMSKLFTLYYNEINSSA